MCVGTGDCWVAVCLAASRAAGHRETHFSTQKYSLLLLLNDRNPQFSRYDKYKVSLRS